VFAAAELSNAAPPYGQVRGVADIDRIFRDIHADIASAQSRAELTRLYRRAGYLVTLTYSRPWRAKFGAALPGMRDEAAREFRASVEQINQRAEAIGTDATYAQRWGAR